MSALHPSLYLLAGAALAFLPRGPVRHLLVLASALLALYGSYVVEATVRFDLGGWLTLELLSPTPWNRPFAIAFSTVCFLGLLYARALDRRGEDAAALLFAAAALGTVLAGDLFTFYCFWELLALSATMLVLGGRSAASRGAAFRYLIYHVAGGLILLMGILWRQAAGLDSRMGEIGLGTPGSWLIFIGLGVNCAWPLLHTWLIDAYPETSPAGVVFLSAFTTKTAVYALLVLFPGTDLLVVIGAVMALFPLFYAVIENDLRRVLAYCLINQVGFMVVGIGIGTDLALNGVVCHAMAHLTYKGILFMAVGACLHRTGYATATDLGGLFRSMPVSAACCLVGAASISFPGFCGFVAKSMITSAAGGGEEPYTLVWMILVFASAGVFLLAGLKVTFFAFFGRDAGHRVKDAPLSMQAAMLLAAASSLVIGLFPHHTVYRLLPLDYRYMPYTPDHVLAQVELLFFSALAFALMLLAGVYPAEVRARNLDFEVVLERAVRAVGKGLDRGLNALNEMGARLFLRYIPARLAYFFAHAPARVSARVAATWANWKGAPPEEIESLRERYYVRFKRSALPVGQSAIYAMILLGILALL